MYSIGALFPAASDVRVLPLPLATASDCSSPPPRPARLLACSLLTLLPFLAPLRTRFVEHDSLHTLLRTRFAHDSSHTLLHTRFFAHVPHTLCSFGGLRPLLTLFAAQGLHQNPRDRRRRPLFLNPLLPRARRARLPQASRHPHLARRRRRLPCPRFALPPLPTTR